MAPHDRWLALDLGLGEAELARDLTRRFAQGTHPALLEFLADQLAALAAEHRATGTAHGLWVLLDAPDRLAPVATATLRLVDHDGDDPLDLLAAVTGGGRAASEAGDPVVRTIATASGPASVVRMHPAGAPDGEGDHEVHAACWLRTPPSPSAVLTAYGTGAAGDATAVLPARLAELAAGVAGV